MKRILLLAITCIFLTVTAKAVGPITGILTTCVGSSTPLLDTTLGGVWSSSTPGVATIGSTGIVSGISPGTTTISYVAAGGTATAVVTVSAAPIITGPSEICSAGGTATFMGTPPGGTWSSWPPGGLTVNPTTGVVTAVSPGGFAVIYAISPTCTASHTLSVGHPMMIIGPDTLCAGSTTHYHVIATDSSGAIPIEGTWSSSDTSIISFPPGIEASEATAHGTGTATITYTPPFSTCITIMHVTVTSGGATISGIPRVCIGGTTTLSGSPSGGTWSSSSPVIATVGTSSGVVTGISPGTTTVTYTSGGCSATRIVTVGAMPAPIAGPSTLCAGATITLFNSTTGGSWISGNTAIAMVDSTTGVVTGISPGVVNITYTTGCSVFRSITVNPSPAPITGSATICLGSSSTYTSLTTGGSWSSSSPTTISINAAGVATAVGTGAAILTYTLPTGCFVTLPVTVTTLTGGVTGLSLICAGASATWVATPPGGAWSSANPSIATVGSTGIVTGISPGTTLISYSVGGCAISQLVTINAGPAAISGSSSICAGSTSLYSSTPGGGTWSTANPAVATINVTSGLATGVSPGFTFITYTLPSGCYAVKTVTVTTTTALISGSSIMCEVGSTTYLGFPAGGTWISSSPSVATIGFTSGIITGVSAGTTTMTYTVGGCFATKTITVNPTPQPVLGPDTVCLGTTATYTSATPGGTWSVSISAFATISASGVLTPLMAGPAQVIYTAPTGCMSGKNIVITSGGAAISGGSVVCAGGTLSLVATPPGGIWTSSDVAIATVGSTGVVTGLASGVATISYSAGGCASTHTVTVTAAPGPIAGGSTVCAGGTITLSNSTPGGTWSVTPTSVATISASGVLTGFTPGSAVVTYSIGSCLTTAFVTVTPGPGPITGAGSICVGGSLTLTNATAGGSWTSGNGSVASVDGATGVVTGMSPGTAIISYTAAGCTVTTIITVSASPSAISGPASLCSGTGATYTNPVGGGSWSVSDMSVATIGASTGVLTGVATGVVTISYSVAGCTATTVVTVTGTPGSIGGPSVVCVGQTITLTNSVPGGTWTSLSPTKATVNATTGIVTGVAAGIAIIQYTTSCGTVSKTISVNASPAAITGASTLCVGITSPFTTSTTGGVWSSSNTAIAAITATGVVTAVSPGVVTISYTKSGCSATKTVTINAVPGPIMGSSIVCVGSTITLTNSVPGGTWASGNPLKATVDATTGVVTGVATGTLNIYYSIGGCLTSKTLTVNASPSAIIGPSSLCAGTTITLASLTAGGIWSSSNSAIATVTATGGLVNGVSAGVVTISYTKLGCSRTKSVTVNAAPGPISGSSTVCIGSTITLTNPVPGGTWTSSNPSRATVDASGVVTGISTGTAIITYATPCGSTTKTITVNSALPPIAGSATLCAGSSNTLSNPVSGGTWSSSDTSVAAVSTMSGIVTGVSAGTATITYTAGGCTATIVVTVNAGPSPITGSGSVCVGGSLTLSSATPGGMWSSTVPAIATVSASGVVTGVATGTAMITYSLGSGCATTTVVTVTAGPSPISGSPSLCVGGSSMLTSTPAGGMWTSSNPSVASVGSSSGLVSGVAPGVAVITYSISGCSVTFTVSVSTAASPITGPSVVCAGTTAAYANATPGGMWSSSNPSVAGIDSVSGILTGHSAGVVVITYAAGGCIATKTVSVNPGPSAIAGAAIVCVGNTIMLTSTPAGGTWASSALSVATIGVTTGLVTGVAPGTTLITYSLGSGCSVTIVVTVTASAGTISGPSTVCAGSTVVLATSGTGGMWTSSSPAIASIDSVGVLTGHTAGVVVITYSNGGCLSTKTVTVNAAPLISGPSSLCAGTTITLAGTPGGGTWASSALSVATIGLTSGIVTGIAPGTTTITYSLGSGCSVTRVVTVTPSAGPITGPSSVCVGGSITLAGAASGGLWLTSNPTIATIDSASGVLTGHAAGVAFVTYIVGSCFATTTVTVTPGPPAIGGPSSVCVGSTIILTNTVSGGTWSSSNSSVAAVVPTAGIVFGVTPGTATITYSVGSCSATKVVTVITAPAAISGSSTICAGSSTLLTDATPGGTWSTSNTSVAAVSGTSGMVTGVAPGSATITYSIGGCFVTFGITVTPAPGPIAGPSSVCAGSSITLTNATPGGAWSSSSPSTATVSLAGVVTGLSSGVVTITYSVGGCSVTKLVTVNATPGAISGAPSVCTGATTVFTNSVPGGFWTSSNPSVASVGATSGVVTGVTAGAAVITYSIGGCFAVKTIGVTTGPSAISGPSSLCVGSSASLFSTPGGGVWSSSNISIAAVSPSGLLTAVGPGVVTITYSMGGCDVTKVVSVNNTPAPIAGGSSVCAGSTMVLTNSVPGGAWTSSNPSVAAVSTSGVVTGISAGGVIITYSIGGCFVIRTVAVLAAPAPIVGGSSVCIGTPLFLSDATPGGVWSVSNPSVAMVSGSGVVNGISSGAVTVSYTVSGCSATKGVTVNLSPSAIAGPASVCAGSSVTFTNTVPGGVWSSSNSSVASVSTAGVVTGNAAGVATITYAIGGCIATKTITVNAMPGAISGAGSVCSGSTTIYTNPVGGGTWSSASPAIATVGITTGVVTGVSSGTAIITYSIGSCFAVRKIFVVACSSFGIGKEAAVDDVFVAAPAFSVFPNPASGYLNISWDTEIGNADIILSDVAGREVSRFSVDGKANGKQQIDVANLTDGMYMISVRSETVQYTSRIVIRR